ncbi:MAG: DUF2167 domain-containing protein [Chitinophagales bacterium]|nr:DUF2167 domain-containing protein [Bacteroidota bacterium]MCB9042446.1 DUF2167 domain-containing protein [Chitinophagales bacterium]
MNLKKYFIIGGICALQITFAFAQEEEILVENAAEIDTSALIKMYRNYIDSIDQTLHYEQGTINLKNNIATIDVPRGYKYLNGNDSEMILTDIWGNPPSEREEDKSLGMLVPINISPLQDSIYTINITYSEEGYIDDEDAQKIDYDELLAGMQEDAKEYNKLRVENGYPTIELVGWASPPYYDHENKKLHWAKELKFGEGEENTLNYNIRILGRKGYLELNAIGGMYVLPKVQQNIADVLQSVNFTEGNKYSDFNPKLDKVAAYGIGGLIAGKVLAKVGILAKLGVVLAKFWKLIALGFVALMGTIKRFFSKDKTKETTAQGGE